MEEDAARVVTGSDWSVVDFVLVTDWGDWLGGVDTEVEMSVGPVELGDVWVETVVTTWKSGVCVDCVVTTCNRGFWVDCVVTTWNSGVCVDSVLTA